MFDVLQNDEPEEEEVEEEEVALDQVIEYVSSSIYTWMSAHDQEQGQWDELSI